MNPFLFLWLPPLMGIINSVQASGWNYNPVTGWFENLCDGWFSLCHIDVTYGGEPKIEREVTKKIASPGRQIGIIIDALDAIAVGAAGAEIDRLRRLKAEIESVKRRRPIRNALPNI